MPAGDGTGPMGMGPMTGRAAGFCAGYGVPGYMNPIPGRGFGMGFGRGRGFWGRGGGRGWRNMFYATGLTGWQRAAMGWPATPAGWAPPYAPYVTPPTREQQLEALKGQAEYFENALSELRKRIQELEAQKAEK